MNCTTLYFARGQVACGRIRRNSEAPVTVPVTGLPLAPACHQAPADEEARLIQARLEGEARGRQEGEEIGKARGLKLGRIALLQELLGSLPTTGKEISGYDETQLRELEDQLHQQLRNRG